MPEEVILLIKTAPEINLKSHFVRKYFTKKLISNMKSVLRAHDLSNNQFMVESGRIYLQAESTEKIKKILSALKYVFGIHGFAIAEKIEFKDSSEIELFVAKHAKELVKKNDTFAVRVNRVGKHDFSSMELAAKLGGVLLEEVPTLKVDLKTPKKEVFIEIRNNFCYLYSNEVEGLKGLPLGVEGSVGVLFTGKKEEFLAALFALKRGCNVFPVVDNQKDVKKVQPILKKLKPYNSFRDFLLTSKKDVQNLIDAPDIKLQAIIQADTKLDKKNIKDNFLSGIPIFRPLLFYSSTALNKELKEFLKVGK